MNALPQQLTSAACALFCAGIGSIHDLRDRRIPNVLCGSAIVAGLTLHTAFDGWRGLGDAALAGLVAGVLTLMFWIAGGMGAGDVKLMIAVGCLTGFTPLPMTLISTAIAGGLLAVAVSLYHGRMRETMRNVVALSDHHRARGLEPHPDFNLQSPQAISLPFALPIAAGCLITFCTLAWEARS